MNKKIKGIITDIVFVSGAITSLIGTVETIWKAIHPVVAPIVTVSKSLGFSDIQKDLGVIVTQPNDYTFALYMIIIGVVLMLTVVLIKKVL